MALLGWLYLLANYEGRTTTSLLPYYTEKQLTLAEGDRMWVEQNELRENRLHLNISHGHLLKISQNINTN